VVETIRLESGHTLTGIVGSNPTLSAISFDLARHECIAEFSLVCVACRSAVEGGRFDVAGLTLETLVH
jgi:hypothetical protein